MSQTQSAALPDIRHLAQQALSQGAFPGGRNALFRVYFDPGVHEAVRKHSLENVGVEICGVLVGRWARDADGPYVHISEAIRGEAATTKFTEVTFTHETWARINEQMDSRFSHLAIVGWYHSHPSFGVFLSERDRFIHEHFFSGPGQVAYVVDPVRKTEGVFQWQMGKPELCSHYWIGDRVQTAMAAADPPEQVSPSAAPQAQAAQSASRADPIASSQWVTVAMQAALVALVFLVGYLLAGRNSDLQLRQAEQMGEARAMLFLNLKPGLREELVKTNADLRSAAATARTLAQEHLKLTEGANEVKDRWSEALQTFDRTSKRLDEIADTYGLSPAEARLFEAILERRAVPAKDEKHNSNKENQKEPKKKDSRGAESNRNH